MRRLGNTMIRALEPVDLEMTRRWRNDPSVSGPALGRRFPITEVGERQWFEALSSGSFPTQMVWAVADDQSKIVGVVRLDDVHWIHRTAMFGIWIGPDHWGNGHATRATRLVCDHAFRDLGIRQIRLSVVAEHQAARAVYEKAGFIVEAVQKRAVLLDDEHVDLVLMVLERDAAGDEAGDR